MTAVMCDPPEIVQFAKIDAFTYEHPFNATVTCDDGYWFGPGIRSTVITCEADGLWSPAPNTITCWGRYVSVFLSFCVNNVQICPLRFPLFSEIICSPPPDIWHATWDHEDGKTTILGCKEGYELRAWQPEALVNVTDKVTLKCLKNGKWKPSASEFYCGGRENTTNFLLLFIAAVRLLTKIVIFW